VLSTSESVDLNTLQVPLADLRARIVELMKEGYKEVPLGDFLLIMQSTMRAAKPK
jgi:hypothetical protein